MTTYDNAMIPPTSDSYYFSEESLVEAHAGGEKVLSTLVKREQIGTIDGDGFLILGQHQDILGGGFEPQETYSGFISSFNMWDSILTLSQIQSISQCEGIRINFFTEENLRI